jgi:hypothetical protein
LPVRHAAVVAPHELHRGQAPFTQLFRSSAVKVSVAAPPNAVIKISRLTSSSSVGGKPLEVALKHEDIRPAGAQHGFAYIDAVRGAIHIEQRAPQAIDRILRGIAHEIDLLAFCELTHLV